MDDLKERLRASARHDFGSDCQEHIDWQAAARISALEAQLAARDAEIAAWLRSGAGITPGPDGFFSHEDACILEGLKDAAYAIEAGAYRNQD